MESELASFCLGNEVFFNALRERLSQIALIAHIGQFAVSYFFSPLCFHAFFTEFLKTPLSKWLRYPVISTPPHARQGFHSQILIFFLTFHSSHLSAPVKSCSKMLNRSSRRLLFLILMKHHLDFDICSLSICSIDHFNTKSFVGGRLRPRHMVVQS